MPSYKDDVNLEVSFQKFVEIKILIVFNIPLHSNYSSYPKIFKLQQLQDFV